MSCWEKTVPRSTQKKAGFWRSTHESQQIPSYLWWPRGSGLQGCTRRGLETKLRAHPGKGGCEIRNPCISSGPLKDDTLRESGRMFSCRTVKKLACVGIASEGNHKKTEVCPENSTIYPAPRFSPWFDKIHRICEAQKNWRQECSSEWCLNNIAGPKPFRRSNIKPPTEDIHKSRPQRIPTNEVTINVSSNFTPHTKWRATRNYRQQNLILKHCRYYWS